MKKEFINRIIREGSVDTKSFRYRVVEHPDYFEICRISLSALDTTAALSDWESVYSSRTLEAKSIYDIDKVSVLMDDHCTREEAERHLERGTCVWTPEDFVSIFVADSDAPSYFLESSGCSSLDDLLEKCRSGILVADDISNGFYRDGDDLLPYVITYCL